MIGVVQNTHNEGFEASFKSVISVYILRMISGNNANRIHKGNTIAYASMICCRMVVRTVLLFPAPIKLLTNEPQVEANAMMIMKVIPDTFLIIFVMAKERSPKCSM